MYLWSLLDNHCDYIPSWSSLGAFARTRRKLMALQTVCAESKEERILPLLSRQTRAQHARSTRIDNVPLLYAEMSGDELAQRIAAARPKAGPRPGIPRPHYQRHHLIQ